MKASLFNKISVFSDRGKAEVEKRSSNAGLCKIESMNNLLERRRMESIRTSSC